MPMPSLLAMDDFLIICLSLHQRLTQARGISIVPPPNRPKSGSAATGPFLMARSVQCQAEPRSGKPRRPGWGPGEAMKKIEAIIKPFKLDEVKEALQEVGL